MQITQKSTLLLQQIRQTFGDVIYYYEPQDYYYYSSSSILNAMKLINNLDHYQVNDRSVKKYQLWRQACLETRHKQNLTGPGSQTISALI